MKRFWARDISPRAAAVVVALALIASVVTGREEPAGQTQPVQERGQALPAANEQQLPDLDLDKLNRADRKQKIANLFASKAWMQQPPATATARALNPAPPSPPPAPTAPSLPFRYFGKWVDGDRAVVFLWKNNEGHSVAAGDTLDGIYQIESITDSAVNFIYLPLGSKQTLPLIQPN